MYTVLHESNIFMAIALRKCYFPCIASTKSSRPEENALSAFFHCRGGRFALQKLQHVQLNQGRVN